MCKTCTTFSARPSLQNDMDGGVAAALIEKEAEQRACPDLDAHWRLDEAQETIQRLTQERDGARADLAEYVQAQALRTQPRPLTPDAITDEMVKRAQREEERQRGDWTAPTAMRRILTAALTEPQRPEGAEGMEDLLGSWERSELLGQNLTADDLNSLADHLAEHGVRVVTEEKP